MTDCANATMRDLLPDHVAGMLDAGADAEVGAHVAGCVDCHAEVALLRVARAVRPVAVPVDVARIVAAVNAATRDDRTRERTVDDGIRDIASARPSLSPGVMSIARPGVPKARGSMVWRMAASVALVAVGGWSVMSMQDRDVSDVMGVATVSASPRSDTMVGSADSASRESTTVAVAQPAAATPSGTSQGVRSASAISVGDLGDFSDDELQTMLDRLERWDGATSADPVTALPVLTTQQRGETR